MDSKSQRKISLLVSNEFTQSELIHKLNVNKLWELDNGPLRKTFKGTKAWTKQRSRKERSRKERLRVNALNMAMKTLFGTIPDYSVHNFMEKKKKKKSASISNINILLIARTYIEFLRDIRNDYDLLLQQETVAEYDIQTFLFKDI